MCISMDKVPVLFIAPFWKWLGLRILIELSKQNAKWNNTENKTLYVYSKMWFTYKNGKQTVCAEVDAKS